MQLELNEALRTGVWESWNVGGLEYQDCSSAPVLLVARVCALTWLRGVLAVQSTESVQAAMRSLCLPARRCLRPP